MTTPSLQDEVAFISSVNADGSLAQYSFYGWDKNSPATYASGWTSARKWGGTSAGTAGGTVTYHFNPASNWSATEKTWFAAGLALWSAVANISFVPTNSSSAGITFTRTNDGGSYTYAIYNPTANACVTGGNVLGTITYASVNIDTTGTSFGPINGLASQGGFTIENLLHEEGHALGLGHSGPYNGGVNVKTQQYSAYDNRRWSLMSYIDPGNAAAKYYADTPVKGGFGGVQPTTIMPLDILAIQRLYGVATKTPLSGGQVFGFNCNITGAIRPFFDFTQNKRPVITIWDKGTNNTLDLSGFTGTARVNLNPGTFSTAGGLSNNIGIAFGTQINKLVCTRGGTTVTCNNNGDTVIGGNGGDTITGGNGNDNLQSGAGNDILNGGKGSNILNGGTGTDTAVYSGNYSLYKITHNANGTYAVVGNGASDTLSAVEVLKFSDRSITLSTAALLAGDPLQSVSSDVLADSSLSAQTSWSSGLADTALEVSNADLASFASAGPDILSAEQTDQVLTLPEDPMTAFDLTGSDSQSTDQILTFPQDPAAAFDLTSSDLQSTDPILSYPEDPASGSELTSSDPQSTDQAPAASDEVALPSSSDIGDNNPLSVGGGSSIQIGWDSSVPPARTDWASAAIGPMEDMLAQSGSTALHLTGTFSTPAWLSGAGKTLWHAAA